MYLRHFQMIGRFFLVFPYNSTSSDIVVLMYARVHESRPTSRRGDQILYFFGIVIPFCLFIDICVYCQSEHKFWNVVHFSCHLLHVSAVVDQHQVDFTTYMGNNGEVETSPSQLLH